MDERADKLASAAHAQARSALIGEFTVAIWRIRQYARKIRPHVGVVHGRHPAPVPRPWITIAAASLLHRLRTGCAFDTMTELDRIISRTIDGEERRERARLLMEHEER